MAPTLSDGTPGITRQARRYWIKQIKVRPLLHKLATPELRVTLADAW